jgi:hypothetical protein
LFLNKRDLFEAKIKTNPIEQTPAFSDYTGLDRDFNAGVEYFVQKFLERNRGGDEHPVYYHVTCATDTRNVKVVFDSCKDIILRNNLQNSGFMEE